MNLIERLHERVIRGRRARVLSERIAEVLPPDVRVLDVGCGDGQVAWLIEQRRPDVRIEGIDVLVRGKTRIPVRPFDGRRLPYEDASVDVVMFNDVLHHADDPYGLLEEAARVTRQSIVIKDHLLKGFLSGPTLRLMDWVGNRRHGVALPYNYWHREQWLDAFAKLDVSVDRWIGRLRLYGWPACLLFDRSLHFVARLTLGNSESDSWPIGFSTSSMSA